jgi:hypothetical protein
MVCSTIETTTRTRSFFIFHRAPVPFAGLRSRHPSEIGGTFHGAGRVHRVFSSFTRSGDDDRIKITSLREIHTMYSNLLYCNVIADCFLFAAVSRQIKMLFTCFFLAMLAKIGIQAPLFGLWKTNLHG